MKVKKAPLPGDSLLNNPQQKYDYVDGFEGVLRDPFNQVTPVDAAKAFFTSGPDWVGKLFALRNKIVTLFGLKTPGVNDDSKKLEDFKCTPGERIGLFQVYASSEKEVILGEDDKHLNFRISLFMNGSISGRKRLTISTTVVFHNLFGRAYFLSVRPFHQIIVPKILNGILKELEKQNEREGTCSSI